MKGYVEIYQGSPETGKLIHSENNMILDGAREHIVNVMSMPSFPSGLSGTPQAKMSVDTSNFNIRAMSIGGPEEWFHKRDSRFYPNLELSTTPEHANGVRYSLRQPYVNNYNFSSAGEHTIRTSIDAFQLIRDQGFTETLGRDRSKNLLQVDYGGSSINLGKFRSWVPDNYHPGTDRVKPFGWNTYINGEAYPDNYILPAREGYSSSALQAIKPYGASNPSAYWLLEIDANNFPYNYNPRRPDHTYRYEYDILKEFPGAAYNGSQGEGGTEPYLDWLIYDSNSGGGRLPGSLGKGKVKSFKSSSDIEPFQGQRIRLAFSNIWAGSSILDNFKVFETHDENGDALPGTGIWDIKTEGTPTVTQMIDVDGTSGLQIDSDSQGDRVTLAHELRLEAGRNYKLRLDSSGTDPIQVRMYRMNDNLDFYAPLEWVDFNNGLVRTVSTSGVSSIPHLTVEMDSTVKAREVEFTIPGSMDDYDAQPQVLDGISDFVEAGVLTPDHVYVLELVIPSEKGDRYSNTFIRNCSLYDLNETLSPNSEFNLRNSFLLNSDFEYRNSPGRPPAPDGNSNHVSIRDPEGAVKYGLVDLSGWAVHSPINHLDPTYTVYDYIATNGSVAWEYSSVNVGNKTIDGYLHLRSATLAAGDTNARISQTFQIPDEYFEGWYDPAQGVIDKYKEPQLFVSWWENNEGAEGTLYGSILNVRTNGLGTEKHYHFSGDTAGGIDMGVWQPRANLPYYYTSGSGNKWKFHSRSIKIDAPTCYQQQLKAEYVAGPKSSGAQGHTRLHDFRVGILPNWSKGTQGNKESYLYLTSANALGMHASGTFVGGNQNTQVPMVRTNVTGLRPDKKFYAIVKYKTNHATVGDSAFKLCFTNDLENYEGADTGRAYKIDNSTCVGEWTDSANPQNGLNAHRRLYHTNNKWVTSSIGPIYGMDNEGFSVSSNYTLTLMTDYSNADVFQAEIDHVRIVDSNFFAGSDLEPWQYANYAADLSMTSEKSNWANQQIPYYGGWRYFNASGTDPKTCAVRPYINTDGTNSWMEWKSKSSATDYDGELRFIDKIKNLGLKAGENMAFSFDHTAETGDWWGYAIRLYSDGEFPRPGSAGSWWYWNPDTFQWEEGSSQKFTSTTNMGVAAYPFQNSVTVPIRLPEEAVDDAVLFIDFRPKGGAVDDIHKFGNFKLYQTYEQKDLSAIASVAPSPLDTTLQASSAGPGKQGHFLNYLEFSSYDQNASSLNTEQILQHGCFLPGSGIVMASSTFGHAGGLGYDNAANKVPNTYVGGSSLSGVLSGTLNMRGVVNSDGFIYENPNSFGQHNNPAGGFTIADSSAGFLTSAIGTLSSTKEIKYILTLSSTDWKFLDYYYGGIGSIGLWTLDRTATVKKRFKEEAVTYPLWTSATGTPYAESLYNMTDSTKNPVFKLFAKKTFQPGGLKLIENSLATDNIDDYLTIIWSIKF